MPKAFFRSITLCALTACGDATGVDKFPNIDGSWSYTNNWSGGGISCSYAPGTPHHYSDRRGLHGHTGDA